MAAIKIRITSPVLARDVYLSFGDLDVQVSDNYFNLLPGETRGDYGDECGSA